MFQIELQNCFTFNYTGKYILELMLCTFQLNKSPQISTNVNSSYMQVSITYFYSLKKKDISFHDISCCQVSLQTAKGKKATYNKGMKIEVNGT